MIDTKNHITVSEKLFKKVAKDSRGYWLITTDGTRYSIDEETYMRWKDYEIH